MDGYYMNIEIPIGIEVVINGTRCVVVKDLPGCDKLRDACEKCVLSDHFTCEGAACCSDERSDGNSVHFEKVI